MTTRQTGLPVPTLACARPGRTAVRNAWQLTLSVALVALLGACASTPMPAAPSQATASTSPPRPADNAAAVASAQGYAVAAVPAPVASPEAATATPSSTPVDDNNSGAAVAGVPVDPLAVDRAIPLNDAAAHTDLWMRLRAGFAMPTLANDLVRQHETWYASRPDYVQRMTERGGRYLYHVLEEVQSRGLPTELALLPFIESAFNPQAMSSARASGMWQFMPATGRDYTLKQNVFRDDRRDVLASTRAALDYLERLHRLFGNWHLALAAYNWGEGNVQKAINRNLRAGLPTDYISLTMPAETQHYVPKLQAVKNLVADPMAYGLNLPKLDNHPYFLSVPIQRDIDVALTAQLAGLSLDEFKALNPQMNKPVILAAGTEQVLLPYDNVDRFVRNLATYRGRLASWTAWVVPRTMKPAAAAQEAGMSEAALREINHIPPRMLVKAGSTLLVPRGGRHDGDVSSHLADNAQMQLAPDVPPLRRLAVKTRRGDTLAKVASRYKVSASQMAQWNKLSPNVKLVSGAQLVVYVPNTKAAPVARTRGKVTEAKANDKPSSRTRASAAKPTTRTVKTMAAPSKAAPRANQRVARQ